MDLIQRMTIPFGEIKLAPPESAKRTFSGYGAAFNNVDSYGDVIAPGAFAQFLSDVEQGKQPWPSMLSQHGAFGLTSEDLTPIGVWGDLAEDGKGLKSGGELANTERGRDMHTLMSMTPRPAIDGLSIGYIAKKADARTKPDEPRRTLREIVVREISPVTFPANRDARVQSVKSGMFTERDFERWLTQDAGLSRSEARIVINQGFKSLTSMRDAGSDELQGVADLIQTVNAARLFQ